MLFCVMHELPNELKANQGHGRDHVDVGDGGSSQTSDRRLLEGLVITHGEEARRTRRCGREQEELMIDDASRCGL
jgi:hypothetical protein